MMVGDGGDSDVALLIDNDYGDDGVTMMLQL